MGNAREHLPESQPKPGPVVRDLGRLKVDGTDAAAELREFLGRMRGRSPQEMLGLVAESRLTRSMLLATLLCVLLLVALTVIPYGLKQRGTDTSASAAEEEVVEAENDEPVAGREEIEGPAVDDEAPEIDAERAVEAMGIGESRVADPGENPMEDKLDKLLDGIE